MLTWEGRERREEEVTCCSGCAKQVCTPTVTVSIQAVPTAHLHLLVVKHFLKATPSLESGCHHGERQSPARERHLSTVSSGRCAKPQWHMPGQSCEDESRSSHHSAPWDPTPSFTSQTATSPTSQTTVVTRQPDTKPPTRPGEPASPP